MQGRVHAAQVGTGPTGAPLGPGPGASLPRFSRPQGGLCTQAVSPGPGWSTADRGRCAERADTQPRAPGGSADTGRLPSEGVPQALGTRLAVSHVTGVKRFTRPCCGPGLPSVPNPSRYESLATQGMVKEKKSKTKHGQLCTVSKSTFIFPKKTGF